MTSLLLAAALITNPADSVVLNIEGWKVDVETEAIRDQLWPQVRQRLTQNLQDIKRTVPAPSIPKLQKVKIWIMRENPAAVGGVYHPSAQWLRDHDMNPEMAGCVQFGNLKNFIGWQDYNQPWMVLHEMAHAYHHQVLNFAPYVKETYEKAKASGKYESVTLAPKMEKARHYGMNNEMEYFAELSESYFGRNDFQPFVRSELKEFDPAGYEMIERAWETGRFAPK